MVVCAAKIVTRVIDQQHRMFTRFVAIILRKNYGCEFNLEDHTSLD